MMRLIISFTLLNLFIIFQINAQNGLIRGTVFDANNGEFLPGVTIFVEGTSKGTITDFDGKFNLSIEPGTYDLRISFISYETVNIKNLTINQGDTILYNTIRLKQATVEISGITVTAQAVRNTETALLAMKKKSANLLDGISAVNLQKTGDSDVASSMKRIPGVSVSDGKYVFIRGLGDRYTKTTLNGIDIPGLDPDRNTLQLDIFPTSLIDNILVYKSFSAELPADFTGGITDITIKDFPEKKKGSISISTGYNPGFHFNKNYLTYKGSNTDFLGFDNGTRKIPATADIPEFVETFSGAERARRYKTILNSFNPVMAPIKQNSFVDYSFNTVFGNQIVKNKFTIGYNVSFSYKNTTEFYKNAVDARYGLTDSTVYKMELREYQKGNYGVKNIMLSALAGFAIKTGHSKYRINFLRLQNGVSKAGIFDFTGADQGSEFNAKQYNLDYSERSLTNLLIDGKHIFQDSKWKIVWKISPTISVLNDPDVRFTRYEDRNGTPTIGTEAGFPERIWRELKEINIASLIHLTKEYEFRGEKNKLNFGGAYTFKERDFSIQKFLLNVRGGDGILPLSGNPDELLSDNFKWPYNGNINYGTTYEKDFGLSNQFNANANYFAAYVSTELSLLENIKTIVGARLEKFTQNYTGQNQQGTVVLNNSKVLNDINLFPSINLIYTLSKNQNMRLSYSKTIARPSFKELSFAEIYDPISGRTFIGGKFRDANDVAGIEYWDGNLVSTKIRNFDLRWELFLSKGQIFSIGGFYKKLYKPIEIVQYATQAGAFQPRNVGDGEIFGIETEFRLNLKSLNITLENFALTSNVTLIKSRIQLSSTEYESRVLNKRVGQSIDKYRDMAGQSPIIINSGITYNGGENGFFNGLQAGLYYNVQGTTLEYVGIVDRPDIYTKPFHSLNINATKKTGKEQRLIVGLKIKNLLNQKRESVFKSFKASDQFFSKRAPGISINITVKYVL
ncbi:MAG: TonB-dependent receptor [Chlorobi bacterium]|nr:TonB-dependent receptor [Chlorobiota bacterium]